MLMCTSKKGKEYHVAMVLSITVVIGKIVSSSVRKHYFKVKRDSAKTTYN